MATDAMAVIASQHINVSYEPHCMPQTYTMSCVTYLNNAGKKMHSIFQAFQSGGRVM